MPNVLLITSDQHNPFVTGYAGDPLVRTPVLDQLATDGTTFTAAYTNSPICMPARSSLATGRYGSLIGSFDNGSPYRKEHALSFGHRAREQGRAAVTFGKLHFDPETDHGFDAHLPLQATLGYVGARMGWARGAARPTGIMAEHARDAAVGVSEYELYDRHTADAAGAWLVSEAPRDEAWVAHVSFAHPHYPYRVPADSIPADDVDVPLPPAWHPADWPHTPDFDARRALMQLDELALTEDELRHLRWVYTGMVQFIDAQVGRVLSALDSSGQADETVVIYTSDHGDMLGSHGFLMKSQMFDASARVPMLLRGPGVAAGAMCTTAASLVDVAPTVLDQLGLPPTDADADLPGRSLVAVAGNGNEEDRVAFSEYHGPGSAAATYMVRQGDWKYVRSMRPDTDPQLFNLAEDPHELTDHFGDDVTVDLADALDGLLCNIVDPVATDDRIRERQAEQLELAGAAPARRDGPTPRTGLGTLAPGWSIPSPEIMAIVQSVRDGR